MVGSDPTGCVVACIERYVKIDKLEISDGTVRWRGSEQRGEGSERAVWTDLIAFAGATDTTSSAQVKHIVCRESACCGC